jgi:hypothetical protein
MSSIIERSGGRVVAIRCPSCNTDLMHEEGADRVYECQCGREFCAGCGWTGAGLCRPCAHFYGLRIAELEACMPPNEVVDLVDAFRIAKGETSMLAERKHVEALVRYIERLNDQEDE